MTAIRIIKAPNVVQHKIIDGDLCVLSSHVRTCTGCYESNEGYVPEGTLMDPKLNIPLGGGCHECGYKGKVRMYYWIPIKSSGRKNCHNCKHLSVTGEDYQCTKQASTSYIQARRKRSMNDVQYKLRAKNCFEAKP